MTTALSSLTPEARQDPTIQYSLRIRSAWALNNFRRFFRLYSDSPKMSGYLIDWFIERERNNAMLSILKAYVCGLKNTNLPYPLTSRCSLMRQLLSAEVLTNSKYNTKVQHRIMKRLCSIVIVQLLMNSKYSNKIQQNYE